MYTLNEEQEFRIRELINIRTELYKKISKINSEIFTIYESNLEKTVSPK